MSMLRNAAVPPAAIASPKNSTGLRMLPRRRPSTEMRAARSNHQRHGAGKDEEGVANIGGREFGH